jgi:hypothetical protein
MSRTHRSDRKTRTITDHDGRTRGVRRSDSREDTRIWSGVVRGTRVGDPLGANGRSQPHSVEGLHQGSLIPPTPPQPRRARWRGWGPGQRVGGGTRDHGRRLVQGTRPPSLTRWGHMEIRHDHGLEKFGQGVPPGRGARGGVGAWVGVPRPPTASSAAPTAPSTPVRPGGRSTKERGGQRGEGRWWGNDECARGGGRG